MNKIMDLLAIHGISDKRERQTLHWVEIQDIDLRRRCEGLVSADLEAPDAGDT